MSLMLMRNVDRDPVPDHKNLGPEVGHIFPYFNKAGVPAVIERGYGGDGGLTFADPVPGMVVVHARTYQLFQVDVDGDLIPIGLRLSRDYNDGRRLGVELESGVVDV